jgi:6-phosphogluconolactonase
VKPLEEIRVVPEGLFAARAAELVLARAREALAQRGRFDLALAGGSTPAASYRELARLPFPEAARWHAWFGDERCVPPDHVASNHRMAVESGLLARLAPENVHRLRGEARDAQAEAERYEEELCRAVGRPPRLDCVLLGLGADGHTASLFPGSPALDSPRWVAAGSAPAEPRARLTLTLGALRAARGLVFLVAGAAKAPVLARTLADDPEHGVPARRARPRDGSLTWLVDRAAAAELARPLPEG